MKSIALLLAVSSLVAAGCSTLPDVDAPVRAVWVTRSSYATPQDVVDIVARCADAGFDTVLFQVRGNGTVYYRSVLEPWSEAFDFEDPGFDPLALAITEAHARGLALHAWVNVMPAWRGPGEPAHSDQLYHAHPEWFWYDAAGVRQPWHHRVGDRERNWYVSLNPCLPEVRAYLVDVFREIVGGYEVDGLHLDYIRFPNEPVVTGEEIPDYPRDDRTLALFAAASGGTTPESDPEAWDRWRTEQVTELVRGIHGMVRATRPRAALSAAVGPLRERALTHYQDPHTWIEEGLVDMVLPMNYARDMEQFEQRLAQWLPRVDSVVVAPGVMVRGGAGGAELARTQLERARAATGSFCVFSYGSLFHEGEELLPYLRELAIDG